jgi:hypothetical protein
LTADGGVGGTLSMADGATTAPGVGPVAGRGHDVAPDVPPVLTNTVVQVIAAATASTATTMSTGPRRRR